MADALRRGYKAAIPIGEDWKYDLIILRHGRLERVQCKYTKELNGGLRVSCKSVNRTVYQEYTKDDIDWIGVYDSTNNKCYYIPSCLLGNGRSSLKLRLTPTQNHQKSRVLWAKDFENW